MFIIIQVFKWRRIPNNANCAKSTFWPNATIFIKEPARGNIKVLKKWFTFLKKNPKISFPAASADKWSAFQSMPFIWKSVLADNSPNVDSANSYILHF